MILIADDQAVLATAVRRVLEHAGLEVATASNGREALVFISHRTPHLILTDLYMPDIDGLALLRVVRQDPACCRVPVLIYTSEFAEDMRQAAVAAGAQGYIVKSPEGWRCLLATIQRLLETEHPRLRLVS